MPDDRLAKTRALYEGYVYQPPRPLMSWDAAWEHYCVPAIQQMQRDNKPLWEALLATLETEAEFQERSQRLAVTNPDVWID